MTKKIHYPYDYGNEIETTNWTLLICLSFFLLSLCNLKFVSKNLLLFGVGLTDGLKIKIIYSYSYIYKDVRAIIEYFI